VRLELKFDLRGPQKQKGEEVMKENLGEQDVGTMGYGGEGRKEGLLPRNCREKLV
jgi:hypothetical protein